MKLAKIAVGGTPDAWSQIGLPVLDNEARVADVSIRIEPVAHGIVSCSFASLSFDAPSTHDLIDGLPVQLLGTVSHSDPSHPPADSDQQFISIDHVVITTDDLTRTSTAIEHVLGVPCARVRDAGQSVTQAFHKLDNTILELVAGPQVKHCGAKWWGFVVTVDDLDRWWSKVGDNVASAPRDAVQPGRRISTIRTQVGLGVPVAVMSPHVRAK